jgi:cytidine deaminase
MIEEDLRQKLIHLAVQARERAYAPYSQYTVGAIVLTDSGKIYDGVNIENAAYPSGICAERVAIFKAVSEGERRFKAIVVATENGGSPCGACRQVMAEFGLDTEILIVNTEGQTVIETTVAKLLPGAFTPETLL